MALAVGGMGVAANAQNLSLGDPAPKLEVKSFVKGEPVTKFEPGKNYVVEFWATWCGPCRTSIPHLTELQKTYPDIPFIGVSVFEQDQAGVKPFVEKMGEKMDYRVALDAVGTDEKANEGAMAKNWMNAAEQKGIPTAFIVDKEGKIAWIGHPMSMDGPLKKVADGTWNLKAAREERRKEVEDQSKMTKLVGKLQEAQKAGNHEKTLAILDELAGVSPALEVRVGPMKLALLIKLDQQDKALELAKQLEKTALGKDPAGLNELAWVIVDPDAGIKPNAKLVEFARDAARRADERSNGKNAAIADTLAKTYFDSGDVAKAIETQERAVRLSRENGDSEDKGMKDRLEK